jgi:hypothetical protein
VLSGASMRVSGSAVVFALVVCLASTGFAAGGESPPPPILPKQFAGWQIQDAPAASKDAAAADPANAALLKEYGFTDVETATYNRDDGRTLKIRAGRDWRPGRIAESASAVLPWSHRGGCRVQPGIGDVGRSTP